MDTARLSRWDITPRAMRRTEHGLNNDSYFVTADEGEFVFRVYRNTADSSRVRDEHEILGRLAMQDLPFAVPVPLRTSDGDTLAVLETPDGPRLAALFHRIPGDTAELSAPNARLAGRALAQLDAALARLDIPVRAAPTLRDVHPHVLDPVAALDELELGADRANVAMLFERVSSEHDALAASLPRQIIHADFGFINVLVRGGTVTGLLDFEFAGADLRAADLACALYITIVRADAGERWPLVEALANGYRHALPLDTLEAAAMPELVSRRSAFGIVHWMGRWRQGIATRDDVLERVGRSRALVPWLETNGPRIALTVAGESRLPSR